MIKSPKEQIADLWMGACGLWLFLHELPPTLENIARASENLEMWAWLFQGVSMKRVKVSTTGKRNYDVTVECIAFQCLIGNSYVAIRSVHGSRQWVMERKTDDVYPEIDTFIRAQLEAEAYGEAKG